MIPIAKIERDIPDPGIAVELWSLGADPEFSRATGRSDDLPDRKRSELYQLIRPEQ